MKQEVKFIWERVQVRQLQPTQRGARSLHLGDFSPKPKPGVSSAGPDDTTAVAKCKGAPPPSAHAQKGYLVSNLSSSGVSVQTRSSRLVWPLRQNKTVLLRKWSPETVNGGGWGGKMATHLRKSLWRFSVPFASCEAASNWPRSWPAQVGPSRASSAQSRSWQ